LFTAEAPGEMGQQGFTSFVKWGAIICPLESLTAATSQISSPFFALNPVVSKSIITKTLLFMCIGFFSGLRISHPSFLLILS